jgi:DNA-binding NarL/FixJ family response regulator
LLNSSPYGHSRSKVASATGRRPAHGLFAKTPSRRHIHQTRGANPGGDHKGRSETIVQPRAEPLSSILCVEHDEEAAGRLAQKLTGAGYAVDVAHDAEVALAKIVANRPSLILCDFCVPRIGGLELLQNLSQVGPDHSQAPFILLTARPCRDSELAARRCGADDCLPKPVDFEMLSAVIRNRLRRIAVQESPSEQSHLTEREKVVLTWVGRGKTSSEIALILHLSERTVNFHCEQAMRRLDVMNRTQAVAKAMTQHLIRI